MITRIRQLNVAVLLAALLSATAMAQTHMHMPEGSKEVRVGLAAVSAPRSEGSALRESFVMPLISAQWSNGVFIDMNQIGIRLSREASLDFGLMAIPRFSRATGLPGDEQPDRRRFTPEMGGFARYMVAHGVTLTSQLLYGGSYDRRGLRLSAGAQFWMPVAEHHSVGVEAHMSLANRSSLQANFAVAPGQESAGFPVHEVSGGLRDSGIGLRWSWEISPKYTLLSRIDWRRLHGSAAASPRVYQPGAMIAGAALVYGF